MATAKRKEPVIQQLSKLLHWWIDQKEVAITYEPVNSWRKGLIVPEYNEVFWLQGRRIAGKTLAMIIASELMEDSYRFTIAQVYSALARMVSANYVETVPSPGDPPPPPPRRKPGRPKTLPEAPK